MQSQSTIRLANETAAHRWSLLCVPLVFRYPESLQFPGRTDQRDFRLYQNAAANAETFATRVRRSGLGRRRAAEASGTATRVQGDAKRDAEADDSAARVYPETHTVAGISKYFPARYRGRRSDVLLCHSRVQASR